MTRTIALLILLTVVPAHAQNVGDVFKFAKDSGGPHVGCHDFRSAQEVHRLQKTKGQRAAEQFVFRMSRGRENNAPCMIFVHLDTEWQVMKKNDAWICVELPDVQNPKCTWVNISNTKTDAATTMLPASFVGEWCSVKSPDSGLYRRGRCVPRDGSMRLKADGYEHYYDGRKRCMLTKVERDGSSFKAESKCVSEGDHWDVQVKIRFDEKTQLLSFVTH